MHYVRLLRPPSFSLQQSRTILSLAFTITTDLGDSFLCPSKPLRLSVALQVGKIESQEVEEEVTAAQLSNKSNSPNADGNSVSSSESTRAPDGRGYEFKLGSSEGQKPILWRSGMRILKLELPVPPKVDFGAFQRGKLVIGPVSEGLCAFKSDVVLNTTQGLVMPAWTSVEFQTRVRGALPVACRRLKIACNGRRWAFVEVEEEIGESIARHVWDAGIMTVCALADVCWGERASEEAVSSLPITRELLMNPKHLKILELGSGVGILGIGLATILQSRVLRSEKPDFVLLTDLPEARERTVVNMAKFQEGLRRRQGEAVIDMEYESLDWQDGRTGKLPAKSKSTSWDLVILSDCTYNVDMLPALVQTLSVLRSTSYEMNGGKDAPGMMVLLATKPRHPSETALFELMAAEEWKILESLVLPLPVLDAPGESIEIYLFGR